MIDGVVKSPTSALRFITRHCGVRQVRRVPRDSRALNLELFTLPSKADFTRSSNDENGTEPEGVL